MKVIQVLRSSKKTTRVRLEDGFELCLDTIPGTSYLGMEISLPENLHSGPIVRPLRPDDNFPSRIM